MYLCASVMHIYNLIRLLIGFFDARLNQTRLGLQVAWMMNHNSEYHSVTGILGTNVCFGCQFPQKTTSGYLFLIILTARPSSGKVEHNYNSLHYQKYLYYAAFVRVILQCNTGPFFWLIVYKFNSQWFIQQKKLKDRQTTGTNMTSRQKKHNTPATHYRS